MLMPRSWIANTHAWMGLGTFPEAPIAEYLARSTSGLAAFYGGLLLILSSDVTKYRWIIQYQAIAIMCLATGGFILAVRAGIPVAWVGLDCVGSYVLCIPMLFYLGKLPP